MVAGEEDSEDEAVEEVLQEEKASAEERVLAHYARDCQSPTTTCNYCKYYDHTIEECPTLIAKIKDTKLAVH